VVLTQKEQVQAVNPASRNVECERYLPFEVSAAFQSLPVT